MDRDRRDAAQHAARYFHGTTAALPPGSIIVPGTTRGTSHHGQSDHVYLCGTGFRLADLDDTEARHAGDGSMTALLAFAVREATIWGCLAADQTCTDPRHNDGSNTFHTDSHLDGLTPSCVHVYEVEPLDRVEADPSSDVNAACLRTTRARVVAEVAR